jgi:hypothetical protein
MTKNEVKALIRKKMEFVEKDYFESFAKKDYEICSYYQGIYRGLRDALQVIGMLDNEHNRLKSSL